MIHAAYAIGTRNNAIVIFAHLIQAASLLPTDTSALKSSISALETSISALESEIARLERSSIPWEYWAWFFTALVLLGVLLELWVIRHGWRDEMQEWAVWYFIGVDRFPREPSVIKLRVEIASVLLIGIGIAGELGTGVEIALINGKVRGKSSELRSKGDELRSASDQLLALVTQQAGEAKDSALIAQASAETAGIEAGKAKAAAGIALSTSNKAVADLRVERGKRVELEESLAPRVINIPRKDDKPDLPLLTKYKCTNAEVQFVNDAEVLRATGSLINALTAAGWTVKPVLSSNLDLVFQDGVSVAPHWPGTGSKADEDDALHCIAATRAVVEFLGDQNWTADTTVADPREPPIPSNTIRIKVGFKPMPYFLPEEMKDAIQRNREDNKARRQPDEQRLQDKQLPK
jgi:hypothetical protein